MTESEIKAIASLIARDKEASDRIKALVQDNYRKFIAARTAMASAVDFKAH